MFVEKGNKPVVNEPMRPQKSLLFDFFFVLINQTFKRNKWFQELYVKMREKNDESPSLRETSLLPN